MALDATVGGSTANSYLTREAAVELMAMRLHTDAWDALSDADKDKSLMMATRLIDRHLCFLGTSATTEQALRFPMTSLVDITGRVIPNDEIPPAILELTAELALRLAGTDYTAPSDADVQGLSRIKAGSIELAFREANTASVSVIETIARSVLPSDWLCLTAEQKAKKAEFRVL